MPALLMIIKMEEKDADPAYVKDRGYLFFYKTFILYTYF